MTNLLLGHKDACKSRLVLDLESVLSQTKRIGCAVNKLYCTNVSCLHHPSVFLEFLPGNRNHNHLSDGVEYHELQLVCHCEFLHCDVEDEDAAEGVPRGSM